MLLTAIASLVLMKGGGLIIWMLSISQSKVGEGVLWGGYAITFNALLLYVLVHLYGWTKVTLFVVLLVNWMIVIGIVEVGVLLLAERLIGKDLDGDKVALIATVVYVLVIGIGMYSAFILG